MYICTYVRVLHVCEFIITTNSIVIINDNIYYWYSIIIRKYVGTNIQTKFGYDHHLTSCLLCEYYSVLPLLIPGLCDHLF